MSNWKKMGFLLSVIFAVGILPVAALENAPYPVTPVSPITVEIGVLAPLSGSLTELGATALATLEIAKDDFQKVFPTVTINETVVDTKSDPQVALQELQALSQKGIRVFIGPFSSEELLAVKSFADQNDIILISPTSTAPSLSLDDNIFRISPDDSRQSMALATFVSSRQIDYIVPVVRDDIYGNEFIEQFQPQFQGLGGETVSPIVYNTSNTDFEPVVAQVKTAVQEILQQAPDAVVGVLAVSFDEIVGIFNAASGDELLSGLSWFGADGVAQNESINADAVAAAFAETVDFTASTFSYNAISHPYLPFSQHLENLITKVLQNYATPQTTQIPAIYDGLWLAGIMQFDAGVTDLNQELVRISRQLVGIIGTIDFNDTGDRDYGFYGFYRFGNAKWTLIAAYRFSKYGSIEPFTDFTFNIEAQDKIVKMGLLLPLSGDNYSAGASISTAIEKAEIDINAVLQRYYTPDSKLELVVGNTNSDPETAYQKLVEMKEQGVQFVIGPVNSAELERVAPYANEQNMILLSPASTSMSLAKKDNVFRLALNDEKQSKALAILVKDQGYSYVEILYRDDIYGQELKQYFTQHFEALGGVCGAGIAYDTESPDFPGLISQAETEVSSAASTYGQSKTAVLLIAFDEVGLLFDAIPTDSILGNYRWFGTDGFAQSFIFSELPRAIEFAMKTDLTASIMGTGTDVMVTPTETMVKDLTDLFGFAAKAFDINGYDAAWIFTLYSIYQDSHPLSDPTQLIEDFDLLTKKTNGYLSPNFLDEAGDRMFGDIEFFKLRPSGNSITWDKYASYVYFINETGPFYFQDTSTSFAKIGPYLR